MLHHAPNHVRDEVRMCGDENTKVRAKIMGVTNHTHINLHVTVYRNTIHPQGLFYTLPFPIRIIRDYLIITFLPPMI